MSTPLWYKRDIYLGYTGPDVTTIRRMLGYNQDGSYDRSVMQRVIGLAKAKNVNTDGEVNAAVAEAIGPSADEGLLPVWYERDLELWCEGEDVRAFRWAMGFKDNDNRFHPEEEAAVRRLQSAKGLPVTGKVDAELARIIR